jgi:hypothetical protein
MPKGQYHCYVGCTEWQDWDDFSTLKEARQFMRDWKKDKWTMGAYTADEAWIEFPDGHKEEQEID